MEKRDYYTISEIFLGLKDYLSEGNKILHELHDLIDIKSDVPYKTYIHINSLFLSDLKHRKYCDPLILAYNKNVKFISEKC